MSAGGAPSEGASEEAVSPAMRPSSPPDIPSPAARPPLETLKRQEAGGPEASGGPGPCGEAGQESLDILSRAMAAHAT